MARAPTCRTRYAGNAGNRRRDATTHCGSWERGTYANCLNSRKAKKPSRIKAAVVRELGDVREWKGSRVVPRSGSKVKPGDAYAAYEAWCAEMRKEPVSLTAFGTIMKHELRCAQGREEQACVLPRDRARGAPKLVAAAGAR